MNFNGTPFAKSKVNSNHSLGTNMRVQLTFQVAQMVRNLPAVQETQFPLLGQEDPLEKGVATHSSVLVWRIPWTEEPGGLQSVRLQESDTTE